jgi:hypothetical protein
MQRPKTRAGSPRQKSEDVPEHPPHGAGRGLGRVQSVDPLLAVSRASPQIGAMIRAARLCTWHDATGARTQNRCEGNGDRADRVGSARLLGPRADRDRGRAQDRSGQFVQARLVEAEIGIVNVGIGRSDYPSSGPAI